jgi:hypothetical protein
MLCRSKPRNDDHTERMPQNRIRQHQLVEQCAHLVEQLSRRSARSGHPVNEAVHGFDRIVPGVR